MGFSFFICVNTCICMCVRAHIIARGQPLLSFLKHCPPGFLFCFALLWDKESPWLISEPQGFSWPHLSRPKTTSAHPSFSFCDFWVLSSEYWVKKKLGIFQFSEQVLYRKKLSPLPSSGTGWQLPPITSCLLLGWLTALQLFCSAFRIPLRIQVTWLCPRLKLWTVQLAHNQHHPTPASEPSSWEP